MELRGNEGERSYAPALAEGKDGNKENTSQLLEEVLNRDNLNVAYKRVMKNDGSNGVDGMKADEFLAYLKQHGEELKQSILQSRTFVINSAFICKPFPLFKIIIEFGNQIIKLIIYCNNT